MKTSTPHTTHAQPSRTARLTLGGLFLAIFALLGGALLHGFPPAPYYTLYGLVRDQVGQVITAQDTTLILLSGGEEIGRTSITSGTLLDQNYELNIRIDERRPGTTPYTTKSVEPEGEFSLVVQIGDALFYPIEVNGNLTAGTGGERVRLDLNLGEDSDDDGLPDVWEQWQLYQAGHDPNASGEWDLSLIDKDGDLDGDGQNNWLEYVAGTFAGDATETFYLEIKERLVGSVHLELFEITGKTYTIERSTDTVTWTRVPFSVGAQGEGAESHTATDVGVRSVYATSEEGSPREFYRLTVR